MTRKELRMDGRVGLLYHAKQPSDYRILYLHGAGEFGNGINALFKHPGLPSLLEDGLELGMDVIIPCGPASGKWESEWIDSFLKGTDAQLPLKTKKYHMMGYSRGCAGVYCYSAYRPGKIASIVVLAGKKALEQVPNISHIPVLLIHGENDAQIPFSNSMDMYNTLEASGNNVELIRDSGDHYISSDIFSKTDIYQWQHRVNRQDSVEQNKNIQG